VLGRDKRLKQVCEGDWVDGNPGNYAPLIVAGIIRTKATTTRDLDRIPSYTVPDDASPDDASPLEVLLAERRSDDR